MMATRTNWKAVFFMVLSTMSFAIMNLLVKYLEDIPAYQLVFFRSIVSLIICISYLRYRGINPLGNQRKALMARGLVGTISMTLFFLSIKYIPLGSAVSIRYLSPIFAVFMAILFLGERVRKLQWFFYAIAFSGLVILKGFEVQVNNFGFLLAVGAAFFSGMVYVIVRKIGTSDHPVVVVGYFMFFATVIGGLLSITVWKTPNNMELAVLASLGLFGFFGQLFMTKALQLEDASKITPMKYLEAVFVLIIGFIWLGETYSLLGLVGIIMIIVGMTLNVVVKKKVRQPKRSLAN